jgi:hypothetical protein
LPFENLLHKTKLLYEKYPPESIDNDVKEFDHKRKLKEQEWKRKSEANRLERERQRNLRVVHARPQILYRLKNFKTITFATAFAFGLYIFLKGSSELN